MSGNACMSCNAGGEESRVARGGGCARPLARSVNHNPTHHWSRTTGHVSSPEAFVFHSFFPSILI